MDQILTTKLFIPPPRQDIVSRPRLIERINEGIKRKLTLICAPAGFGKTTLLSDWVRQTKLPTAWLSLDTGDNDLTHFLVHLIAALQTVESGICETVKVMLHAPQPPLIGSMLTELINEVAQAKQSFALILDDYHVIDVQEIHESLIFLLNHLPLKMHLIISSRSDPLLQIPIMRAKGQLTELRANDLRFTILEATSFLKPVMGLALSEDDILSLETRTEGWIAGLHLAALSMRDKDNPAEFVAEFAGDDRYIVDYLVDEVLAQRSSETKNFLLKTSILDRMTSPLCDAVTGREDGQEQLEKLDQANLFIVPLDNRRHWYRYHHLFADLLRHRLKEEIKTDDIKILHQRASQWYEENDFLVEAVDHALAAEDLENVIRLIEFGSMDLLMRGQQSNLLKWQSELPRELVASHPRLCMTIAWAWLSRGHTKEAEAYLQYLERSLGIEMAELLSEQERSEEIDPAVQILLVEIAVMRIELANGGGDIPQVLKLSQIVLPYLEDEKDAQQDSHLENLRSVVYFALGLAHKICGKLSEASEALSKAAVLGQELGNVYIAAGSIGRLAGVQSMQGQLNQALNTCQRGMNLIQEVVKEPPMSGLIHAELGNLLYERNELDAALHHLQKGIDVAWPWGYLEALVSGYTGLARLRASQGDWDGAFAAVDELTALGERNPTMVMPEVETLRATLWVAQGKVEAANRWVINAGIDPDEEINFHRLAKLVILARVLIAQRNHKKAVNLLSRMIDATRTAGWFGRAIEIHILLALTLKAQGENDQAMTALEQALILAESEGYVRVFVNEGDPLKALLSEADSRGIAQDYILKLLKTFETDHVQVELPSALELIELLSERELEVLRLLKTELSGPEIADHLMIALSTLRTHTQNIYGKLGVSNRRAAIHKAEELNLR